MGDVFDRVVSRAGVAPDRSPGAGLTTRRGRVVGVPDASGGAAAGGASAPGDAGLREVEVERLSGEGDHTGPRTGRVGSAIWRDSAGSGPGSVGPHGAANPAIRPGPPVGGRDGENEPDPAGGGWPQAAGSTYQPRSEAPTLGPDLRGPTPDSDRSAGLDLSPQRAPRGDPRSGPERGTELADVGVVGPARGPAPGEAPADTVAAGADVAIGVEVSDARTPGARPTRTDLRARPRPPRPAPTAPTPPARTVSAEELLREHLAPVLVDRGALHTEDAARLTAVGLDPIETPAGGDVHVHLGQVVIQQAVTPAVEPSRPASRDAGRPDRVDHADYLARQRRRW